MNVLKDKVNDQETLIIEMGDKFDFSKVEAFRSAYQDLDSDVKHITVDLAKTEYMDSSALGMLLNMQKVLSQRSLTFSIENSRPPVERILKISRFDKNLLFVET